MVDVYGASGASGKELACDAGETRDTGLIPGSGRYPGGRHDNPSSILPWTDKPGSLHTIGLQRVRHD